MHEVIFSPTSSKIIIVEFLDLLWFRLTLLDKDPVCLSCHVR